MREVPDGRQLLDSHAAAELAGVTQPQLIHLTAIGALHPARYGRQFIYTRAECVALRQGLLDREIGKQLARGVAPIEIWEALPLASIDRVARVLRAWARLSGYWVIEAPPGSYARWLSRFGLTRLTARDLRRMIERLLDAGPPK